MTIDAAFAALVEANPIPDANAYAEHRIAAAAFLTATRERTTEMQTIETQEPTKATTPRKWQPLMAVAAFFLVIALGIAAVMVFGGTKEVANVPAPPFDTPQDAAQAYHAALNAGDGDAYFAIMAEGASDGGLNYGAIATDDKLRARVEWFAAVDISHDTVECTTETELQARCTVTIDNGFDAMIAGVREWEGTSVVTIDDQGRIARISGLEFAPMDSDDQRAQAFFEWLSENEPQLDQEFNALWGSDPVERSGTEIGQDVMEAVIAFDAQYSG